MRKKVLSYLGFAAKSRNLVTGYNTCVMTMNKKKLRLLILAQDVSDNTREKLEREALKSGVPYRTYGSIEELSSITGNDNKGIFGITDNHFAKIIKLAIDSEQSCNQEVFE